MSRVKLRPLSRRVAVVATIVGGVVAVGAAAAVTNAIRGDSDHVEAAQAAESAPPPPPAVLKVVGQRGAGHDGVVVPWNKRLQFAVTNGRISGVELTRVAGGPVAGDLAEDGASWTTRSTLLPTQGYAATVTYLDLLKARHQERFTFKATDAPRLTAVVGPGDDRVVGIGAPVSVTFNREVPAAQRPAVLSRLTVATDPPTDGAWHWMNGQELHWRPPAYWKPGTKVTVASRLDGLDLGNGVWGAGQVSTNFRIGNAHVAKVDIANHVMRVYVNGALARTMPISAGKAKYPTRGGIHITMDKHEMVIMDSATVGIPKGDPDYYYEKIPYAVRITNSGTFTHSAPWSVKDQGRRNVSHGCINLSPANALWFYNLSQWGDIVEVYNTPVGPYSWDAGTRDWNMTWAEWTSGATVAHNLPRVPGTPIFDTPTPKPVAKPTATASATPTPKPTASAKPTPTPTSSPH